MDGFPLPGVFYALRAPICVSATAEEQKMGKTVFRPRLKSRKWEKQCFGHGRRVKIGKNYISAVAER